MKKSFVIAQLPKTGLGNKMIVWARAFVFSKLNNLPLYTTPWAHISWGALLRNETKKRWYKSYFKELSFFARWYWNFSHFGLKKIHEPPIEKIPVASETKYIISKLVRTDDFFLEIRNHRDEIKDALVASLHTNLKNKIASLQAPCIGVHVRRGDFVHGSTITPLSFFIDTINDIRSTIKFNCPVTVYTDAKPGEIEALLKMENVSLASQKEDILDILELSQSKILLMSIGSTFSYWAAFLSNGIVFRHEKEWHVLLRPAQVNDHLFEGVFKKEFLLNESEVKMQLENILANGKILQREN